MDSSSYRNFLIAAALVGLVLLLFFPDVAIGLLLEFFHSLFELIFGFFDTVFEIVEASLDHLVEYLFDTDLHQTQTIVFYLMVIPLIYAGYRLLRRLPSVYRRCRDNMINAGIRYKSDAAVFWQNLSPLNKIKLIAAAALAFYLIFLISF
ncbi:MAG: hypothetical protein ACU84H_04845 [Gammaproteobacteria bacterium]